MDTDVMKSIQNHEYLELLYFIRVIRICEINFKFMFLRQNKGRE